MKPLFIPLKRAFFNAFTTGAKTVEYRIYGPRDFDQTMTETYPVPANRPRLRKITIQFTFP